MKLSCDEATKICDKNQYGSASFWEKIKLTIHLFLCKTCGMYTKQNDIMTKCYKKHIEHSGKQECCLEEEEKKCMHEEVTANM